MSRLAGLLLAVATPAGALLPDEHGYTAAALSAFPPLVISSAFVLIRHRPQM
jgi:hypothetical protein